MLKGLHLPSSKISKTMSPDVQLLVPQLVFRHFATMFKHLHEHLSQRCGSS